MRSRVLEMDWLRGLAVLAVVAIHVSGLMVTQKPTYLGMAVNQFARFAVPAYLFLSGLGLAMSKRPYTGYFRFVWYRISKLLPLYVLWTVIYVLKPVFTDGRHFIPMDLVYALVNGKGAYHLYFIPLIIQCYLLFPLIARFLRTNIGLFASLCITLSAQVVSYYLTSPGWVNLQDMRNVLVWLFYFALGVWSAEKIASLNVRQTKLISALLVAASLGLVVEVYINLAAGYGINQAVSQVRPTVVLYSLIFGAWVWSRDWSDSSIHSVLTYLSNQSYEIYLSHVFVLREFVKIYHLYEWNLATPMFLVAALLVTVGASIGITMLISYANICVKSMVRNAKPKQAIGAN